MATTKYVEESSNEIEKEVRAEHRPDSAFEKSFKRRSRSLKRITKIPAYSLQLITGQEDEAYYTNEIAKLKIDSKCNETIAAENERDEKQITGVAKERAFKKQYKDILLHQNQIIQHANELSFHMSNDYKEMAKQIDRLTSQVKIINTKLKNELSKDLDNIFKNLTDLENSFQSLKSSFDFNAEI